MKNQAQLVVVGNGMATGRLLDDMLARSRESYRITVVGDEPEGSYNRIMLSPVLAGEHERNAVIQKSAAWYKAHDIQFIAGVRGVNIHRDARQLQLSNGKHVSYDHLVMATGARPARIPANNQQLNHIYAFRTLVDVDAISAASEQATAALVVGGGLLGLEAAYGLAKKGIQVTLVHRSAWPLNRQLDKRAGEMLCRVMENKNIRFALNTQVETFIGESAVKSAKLADGQIIPCDIAVIATGITPNKELGEEAGLACGRGVIVDEYLSTSDPSISALGECCEINGATFGLVEPIWQQCRTLADRLCLNKQTPFVNAPVATKLKVSGVQVFSAGDYLTRKEHREIVLEDKTNNIYRKLLLRDNQLQGIVLFGDTRDGNVYFEWMEKNTSFPKGLSCLPLGKAFFAGNDASSFPAVYS